MLILMLISAQNTSAPLSFKLKEDQASGTSVKGNLPNNSLLSIESKG